MEKNNTIYLDNKISFIYDKISDKILTLGTLVRYTFEEGVSEIYMYLGEFENIDGKMKNYFLSLADNEKVILDIAEIGTYIKIIGKLLMIGDILDYIDNKIIFENLSTSPLTIKYKIMQSKIINLWGYKRISIEFQSKECINLISDFIS